MIWKRSAALLADHARGLIISRMFAPRKTCFRLTGAFKPSSVLKGLPKGSGFKEDSLETFEGVARDTFDGLARRAGKVPLRTKEGVALIEPATGVMLEQACLSDWKFAADLKGGDVGVQLSEISELRAFLPAGNLAGEIKRISLLDELEKTVSRLTVTSLKRGRERITWISTEALRGYDAEQRRLEKALEAADCERVTKSSDLLPAPGVGAKPYASKPTVPLSACDPVIKSESALIRVFLKTARRNEEGAREDWDTEFIHDYRVSLRRVRSLLSLFKGVYAEEAVAELKRVLGDIMKQTNRLRDLDVYLLGRAEYYELVPESVHAGLDVMFNAIEKQRGEAFEGVRSLFNSPDYDKRLRGLQRKFRADDGIPKGPAADEPTGRFALKLIRKKYAKVARIGARINKQTPDETVHELRLECKKTRYLLEFFAPLFKTADIKPLIKSLKGLQDALGWFNDCSVQRESLATFVERHPTRGQKGLRLAESVGALVATLYQRQLAARRQVESRIDLFVNDQTRADFERLKTI